MNFNNILIGSEDAPRLVEYYTKLFGEPAWPRAATPAGRSARASSRSGRTRRSTGATRAPGRLIWNIESHDVKGDFEKFKAAGAMVVTRAVRLRGRPGLLDRDLRGPRRQLLPADVPVSRCRRTLPSQGRMAIELMTA